MDRHAGRLLGVALVLGHRGHSRVSRGAATGTGEHSAARGPASRRVPRRGSREGAGRAACRISVRRSARRGRACGRPRPDRGPAKRGGARRHAGPGWRHGRGRGAVQQVRQVEQIDVWDDAAMATSYAICRAAYTDGFPDDPLPTAPEVLARARAEVTSERYEYWALWSTAYQVGVYRLDLPLADNLDLVDLSLAVAPEHQRRGHGRVLLDHALQRIAELGRHQVIGSVNEPPTGENRPMRFAAAAGASRSLGEMRRTLDLRRPRPRPARRPARRGRAGRRGLPAGVLDRPLPGRPGRRLRGPDRPDEHRRTDGWHRPRARALGRGPGPGARGGDGQPGPHRVRHRRPARRERPAGRLHRHRHDPARPGERASSGTPSCSRSTAATGSARWSRWPTSSGCARRRRTPRRVHTWNADENTHMIVDQRGDGLRRRAARVGVAPRPARR